MTQKRRRSKRWLYWLLMLILLIAAGVVIYLIYDNYFNDNKKDENRSMEVVTVEEIVEQETKEEAEDSEPEEQKAVQYDGEDPNTGESLTGVITYAAVSGSELYVRLNIDQYLSGGSCEIRLVREDDINVYSETVNIVSSASTATCEGFNIPLSKIGSGNYKIYVNLESGDKSGTVNGEVNI